MPSDDKKYPAWMKQSSDEKLRRLQRGADKAAGLSEQESKEHLKELMAERMRRQKEKKERGY